MDNVSGKTITVETKVRAPLAKVWQYWTKPTHITKWNFASDDWHSPSATNDLKEGGIFNYRMESKDGAHGFDFEGVYTNIIRGKVIEYKLADGRKVKVTFDQEGDNVTVTETFETESVHSEELQRNGWQAILDNFRKHVESNDIEPLHFETEINASASDVYAKMLDSEIYKEWTKGFNPSSRFEGSWEKGSRIRFIGCDEHGNEGGMISRIDENIPNKFVSIEHIGVFDKDGEKYEGPEIDIWKGFEEYTFEEANGKTILKIDSDVNQNYRQFFLDTWPKALAILKSVCESK